MQVVQLFEIRMPRLKKLRTKPGLGSFVPETDGLSMPLYGAAANASSTFSMDDLSVKQIVGVGAFGKVKVCQSKKDGGYYAMKIMNKKAILNMGQAEHVIHEKRILALMDHPFIVRFAGSP